MVYIYKHLDFLDSRGDLVGKDKRVLKGKIKVYVDEYLEDYMLDYNWIDDDTVEIIDEVDKESIEDDLVILIKGVTNIFLVE